MRPLLVIDLSKGRARGSANDKHLYLWRYRDLKGKWRYVPDQWKKEYGSRTADGRIVLAEGWTPGRIIRDFLLGEPRTGEVKTTDAGDEPVVRDGRWIHYECVPESVYRRKVAEGTYRDGKRVNPYKHDALSTTTIEIEHRIKGSKEKGKTRWFVFGYSKMPVVERDADGKPTQFAGFIRPVEPANGDDKEVYESSFSPALRRAGWTIDKLPADVRRFMISKPAHVIAAYADDEDAPASPEVGRAKLAVVAPERKPRGEYETPPRVGMTHELPEGGMHTLSAKPDTLHDLDISDEVDPFAVAKQVYDSARLKLKKRVDRGPWARVLPFDRDVLDKFHDEQELLDKLRYQPLTTLVTIGAVRPTKHTRKFNEELLNEWTGAVAGLAREDFDAFKATEDYQRKYDSDAAREEAGKEPVHVKRMRHKVMGELTTVGIDRLYELALEFGSGAHPGKRFDSYGYVVAQNAIKRHAGEQLRHMKLMVPIVHEGMAEEAARKNRSTEPLNPLEQMELHEATPVARATLTRILSEMPEKYRKVMAARHWLDEPVAPGDVPLIDAPQSPEEERDRKLRQDVLEHDIRTAAEQGTTIVRRTADGNRPWVGRGSVAEKVAWTDAAGKKVGDLSGLSKVGQLKYVKRTYADAREHLVRELTRPVDRYLPRRRRDATDFHGGGVQVRATREELAAMPAEERLVHAATGTVPRVWTDEGHAVRTYLRLAPRADWSQATHVQTSTFIPLAERRAGVRGTDRTPLTKRQQKRLAEVRARGVVHEVVVPGSKTPRWDGSVPASPEHAAPHVEFWMKNPALAAAARINLSALGTEFDAGRRGSEGDSYRRGPERAVGLTRQANVNLPKVVAGTLQRMKDRYEWYKETMREPVTEKRAAKLRLQLATAEARVKEARDESLVRDVYERNKLQAQVAFVEHALRETKKSLGPLWSIGAACVLEAA